MIIPAVPSTPFKIFGTDAFDINLNWKDGEGVLFNLTGWHARMRLFVSKADRTLIKEVTDVIDDELCVITLGDGTTEPNIAAHMPDEAVVALTPESDSPVPAYLTFEVEDPDGNWNRLLEGKMKYEK